MRQMLRTIVFILLNPSGPATSPQPPPTNADVKNGAAQDTGQMDLSKVLQPQQKYNIIVFVPKIDINCEGTST